MNLRIAVAWFHRLALAGRTPESRADFEDWLAGRDFEVAQRVADRRLAEVVAAGAEVVR